MLGLLDTGATGVFIKQNALNQIEHQIEQVKPNSKPFCAQAYKIPQNIFKIAREEVEEPCRIGVLEPNVYSEWGAPCLRKAKKNGGVRFLTDLCQLNKCLIRKPVHLPLIDEVI
jgi:hypothetical protein